MVQVISPKVRAHLQTGTFPNMVYSRGLLCKRCRLDCLSHVLTEPVPLHTHPRIWKALLVGSFSSQNKLGRFKAFQLCFVPVIHWDRRGMKGQCNIFEKHYLGRAAAAVTTAVISKSIFSGRPSTLGCPKCPQPPNTSDKRWNIRRWIQARAMLPKIFPGKRKNTCGEGPEGLLHLLPHKQSESSL